MPLIKLWNTLRGNSAEKAAAKAPTPTAQPSDDGQVTAATPAAPPKPKLSLRDRFSGGPHASICRLVQGSGALSVLEIGVGTGERAFALTAALVEANPEASVRYVAIDMFEMADGPITLKDFHKRLRTQGVQPTLIPMDVCGGLNRVSSTIGVVDLVLIAQPNQSVDIDRVTTVLRKIATPETDVYQLSHDANNNQHWDKLDLYRDQDSASSSARRAA